MGTKLAFRLMRMMYREYLRELLVEAVKSTETEWDDQILDLVDFVFGINPTKH